MKLPKFSRTARVIEHSEDGITFEGVMPKKCTANSSAVFRNPWPVVVRQRLRFGAGPLRVAVCWLAIGSSGAAQDAGVAHPLDPLSKEEIAVAAQTLKAGGKVTEASRFATIVLREPPKAEVLNFKPGAPMRREAFVVVYVSTFSTSGSISMSTVRATQWSSKTQKRWRRGPRILTKTLSS